MSIVENKNKSWSERKENFLLMISSHYKKFLWVFVLSSIILSGFFYNQAEQVLNIAPIVVFTWIFLAVSVFAFSFRKRIKAFFENTIYNDQDYIKKFYEDIEKLDEKSKAKAPSPSQPLNRMMFFINGFLWLNIILFLGGKIIGSYIGFNLVTAPIAVICVFGQMFLAYKTIQLMSKNLMLLIKIKSEK